MNDTVIRVEQLSKKFQIGRRQEGYKTLRDTITDAFVGPFRKAGNLLRGQAGAASRLEETIWALNDVSFEFSVARFWVSSVATVRERVPC